MKSKDVLIILAAVGLSILILLPVIRQESKTWKDVALRLRESHG